MICPKCIIEMVLGRLDSPGFVLWCPPDLGKLEPLSPRLSKKSKTIMEGPAMHEPISAYRCPECTMIIIEKSEP
jgi:hypothetical protein